MGRILRQPEYPKDDTLERAIDATNLPDLLNDLCPTPETARLNRDSGGVICDPRPGRAENNASFSISKRKGRWLWHRFGSKGQGGRDEGGTAYALLLELGMSPRDAARLLIDRAGITPTGAPRQTFAPHDPLDDHKRAALAWKPVRENAIPVAQHGPALAARGFTTEHATAYRLADDRGRILIPITDPVGRVLAVKVRHPDGHDPRYSYATDGHGSPPWCSPELPDTNLLIIEGEGNAIAAHIARPDLQIIGISGVSGKIDPAWVADRNAYVYCDADPDGRGIRARDALVQVIRAAGGNASPIEPLEWPTDFNDILRDRGPDALRDVLSDLIGEAPAPLPDQSIPSLVNVYEQHGCYWQPPIKKNAGPQQLTNWTFEPEMLLEYPGGRQGTRGTVISGHHRVPLDIPAEAWNSRADLLAVIGQHNLLFMAAGNADVARLRAYLLHREAELGMPTCKGVETYGEHDTSDGRVSVFADGILGSGGELELAPVFYGGPDGLPADLHALPPSSDPRLVPAAVQAARDSLALINPPAALAVACKAASALLAPRLTRHYGDRNPFLTINGERESGKSSYAELWLRITTGRTSRTVKAPDIKSDFQYDNWFAGQNNMLALLDEYHPEHIDHAWLKGHYDLTRKRRGIGRGAASDTYHRNSPTVILGQHGIDDSAARSRSVHYLTLPGERGTSEQYKRVFDAPLEHLARPLHQAALRLPDETLAAWVEQARDVARRILGDREPRLEIALIDLAVGAKLLNHALNLNVGTNAVELMLEAGVAQTLEGGADGGGQRSSVEQFLEQLGFAAKLRAAQTWCDYFAIPDGDRTGTSLIVRSTACVELVKQTYRDKAAITSGVMFGKLANSLPYFEAPKGGVTKGGGRSIRGVILTFAAAPQRVDLDALVDIAEALTAGSNGESDRG